MHKLKCASTFVSVYWKAGLTPCLFLAQYTQFCLCVMPLCSEDMRPGRRQQRGTEQLRLCSLTLTLQLLHQSVCLCGGGGSAYKIPGQN